MPTSTRRGSGLLAVLWAMALLTSGAGMAAEPPATGTDPGGLGFQPVLLIQLAVADLDRSIAFYRDTLGLELQSRNDQLRWARIRTAVPGVVIGLGEQEPEAVEGSGSASFNLAVGDLDAARALLEERGVEFLGPTVEIPGVVRLADFLDPDGNRLRLAGAPSPPAVD